MVLIKLDNDGNISTSSPKTVKVRILREVTIKPGVVAIVGDVWELARVDAIDLIAADSAARVITPGEFEIQREGLEVIAPSENDPQPKLLSRIPLRDRKPRPPTLLPLNLPSPGPLELAMMSMRSR